MNDNAAISSAYRTLLGIVGEVEPRISQAIRDELTDQRASLKLIASENYASLPVLAAMGTWLSDKYAEGTIGHRFYAGCQNVDTVESVAAEHARELFGAEYAYAQPHSGIDANLTAYWAILAHHIETPALKEFNAKNVSELTEADWETLRSRFGSQRLLGMSLDAGGHLTHGFRPNVSGKMFHQRSYGTNPETGLLDYDALAAQAADFKPLVIVAGYSAYPRRIDFAKMREIADSVGAVLMVEGGPLSHIMAAKAVALAEARTEAFQDYAHRVADNAKALAEGLLKRGGKLVTGGTDNHIVLLDVTSFGLTGRQAESALLDAGIVTNRNSVPNDPNGAWYTSGVRLGTPALTSRGFTTADMDEVAAMITDVLKSTEPTLTKEGKPGKAKYELSSKVAEDSKDRAAKLLEMRPLYPGLEI